MSELHDTLARLDALDQDNATAVLTNIEPGEPVDLSVVAQRVCDAGVSSLCEAFGLDPADLYAVAHQRGALQASTTLQILGQQACPEHAELFTGLVCGGILTGIRLGLMVADSRHRDER